ncbi:MAG: hypothetical protein ACQKBU_00690 [Verrucomicrobiales bacterium]
MTIPWIIAAVFAGLALFALAPPNAAGGGLVLGIIGGLVHALFFNDGGFQFVLVAKWTIVCVLIGYFLEVIHRFRRFKSGNPIDD